jgi:hypothetical protein
MEEKFKNDDDDETIQLLYDYLITEIDSEEKIYSFIDIPFSIGDCEIYCEFYIFNSFHLKFIDIKVRLLHFLNNDHEHIVIENYFCNINDFNNFKKIMKNLNSKIESKDWIIYDQKIISIKNYEIKIKCAKFFKNINIDKCWICLDYCLPNDHLKCKHLIHLKCAENFFKKNNYSFTCGICKKTKYYNFIKL